MFQEDAKVVNDEAITVTMNGEEAAAITMAIASYSISIKGNSLLRHALHEDVRVLNRWIQRIKPAVYGMAERQAAALASANQAEADTAPEERGQPLKDEASEEVAKLIVVERGMSLEEARETIRYTIIDLSERHTAQYDNQTQELRLTGLGSKQGKRFFIFDLDECYSLAELLQFMLPARPTTSQNTGDVHGDARKDTSTR